MVIGPTSGDAGCGGRRTAPPSGSEQPLLHTPRKKRRLPGEMLLHSHQSVELSASPCSTGLPTVLFQTDSYILIQTFSLCVTITS